MAFSELLVLVIAILGTTYAQDFYVAAPNTLRLDSEETIAIAVDGPNGAAVRVYVQDHPGKVKNISEKLLPVQPGQPEIVKIQLSSADFPPNFLSGPGSPKLVSLNVHSDNFRKEITIPISTKSGYVFIQTDKPIYTPRDRANIRIIPLNEESEPSDKAFKLQIKNPNDNIVEEKVFNQKAQGIRKSIVSHIYKFPTYPVLGEWSAAVLYGYDFQQNHTVRFTLREYVLPTFTVEVETDDVILPSTERVKIKVDAKHVYGKKVKGLVTFRVGVKGDKAEAKFFAVIGPRELAEGSHSLELNTEEIKKNKDIGWFPEIEGSHLVIEANVMDDATGNVEKATNAKGIFSKSPFIISFKRCLKDFKPGLVSVFEADINYVDGKPASRVAAKIKALADGQPLNIVQDSAISDEEGKVTFEIQPELHHSTVSITIETNDPRYIGSQATGKFDQRKFESPNKAYIALARSSALRLQPGDMFTKTIHFEPAGIRDIYYLVVSKGKILAMNKLPPGQFKIQRVEFEITHEMVPSFRVVVFAHYKDELIADSLKIEVQRMCNPKAEVTVSPEFDIKEPGSAGKIIIRGEKGTLVGLLGVDEAVYALSKQDLLTKNRVFNKLETHDLGCGPGGGMTINSVLGNAGITVGTNKYNPSLAHTCVEIKRRKRDAARSILDAYEGTDRECCSLGIAKDKYNRNCQERTNVLVKYLDGRNENCAKAFLECCLDAKEKGLDLKLLSKTSVMGRIGGDNFDHLDFIPIEDEEIFEKDLTVRRDFRETWIYEDILIGPDNREEHHASLPHSITTWVIQAVSVSPKYGICVAEPQKLVSFKKIFLHLNLPYSVIRNEQVEIQATVFNYGNTRTSAVMYMYGAKDLCTGTQPGEKSERKRLVVDGQSAASASFPVVPLKAEDFPIKVVVLTPEGSDVIERPLHVVHEGVPKEIDVPIKLDPSNQQRRAKRHIETNLYTDSIDSTQNLQVTSINITAPDDFVPGTASCTILALGDQFGPVVATSLQNPDGLLQQPRGCGEQNMMFLAPTMYTMRYLKVTGRLTAANEEKGYGFIRLGYGNQLAFRKEDGSYAAYQTKPTSAWLTAFVMKVFCQANELVHIDENVLCTGVKWLIQNQEADGSYIEKNPMYHLDMMGGVQGKTPMTAFTLIALEECKCDEENLLVAKKRAVAYLEDHLADVTTPLPVAIVAYALALSDSELKQAANDKLLSLAQHNEDLNMLHWPTANAAQDIETAGYGLLTQLLFNDLGRSNSIVNWLNSKQLQSGSFKSTQDTVVALQALSEYAIRAQMPSINLVTNITSSNDRNFYKILTFRKENALLLQDVKVDKIGGRLFISTAGHGIGSLTVKMRYNVIVPPEEICKFDVTISVEDAKEEEKEVPPLFRDVIDPRGKDVFEKFPDDLIRGAKEALDEPIPILDGDPRNRGLRASLVAMPPRDNLRPGRVGMPPRDDLRLRRVERLRVKRQNAADNSKIRFQIGICVRYLGNQEAGMSIVDVGTFSGFEPVVDDLKKLESDPNHLIDRYEKSSRSVVFYLRKVPTRENYCFSFHVIQEYLVGKTQMSVVKVYDYYNPDAACSKFYNPGSNSPLLHKICEGGVCECAEGGCPPRNPFAAISEIDDVGERREKLKEMACDKFDYVWRGKLKGQVKRDAGFLNITFEIEDVIKEGIEKRIDIEGETRMLLARDKCETTAPIHRGATYLILGRDGQKYKASNGETWYRYLLDRNSAVQMWTSIKESQDKKLQRDLNHVTKALLDKGCEL